MKNLKTKLSYALYTLLGAFLLASCCGSTDESKCLQSVKEKFPNAKIYTKYDGGFTFVAVDSANVYLVKTLSLSSPKVTDVYVLESK